MTFITFHSVGKFIIPTDEVIFFRGVAKPPTSYIYMYILPDCWLYSHLSQLYMFYSRLIYSTVHPLVWGLVDAIDCPRFLLLTSREIADHVGYI
jgi:hypothetical protein